MQIKIKCKGSATRKLSDLKVLQGDLKDLSVENKTKLRKRIEKFGFDAPFFVYKNHILDGTQRLAVLEEMLADGFTLPKGEVPIVEIMADSMKDAKKRILGYVSQFGKLTSDGLSEFIEDLPELDFDLLDLPDFDMDEFKLSPDDLDDDFSLPDGDKGDLEQITFTLSKVQAEQVNISIAKAKEIGEFIDTGNENSNGNAIARVCELFNGKD